MVQRSRHSPSYRHLLPQLGAIAVACVFLATACDGGGSQSRKVTVEEARQKRKEAKAEILGRLRTRFHAVDFPGPGIPGDAFTFELQRVLHENRNRAIVSTVFIEDVEEVLDGVVIEFSRQVSDTRFADEATLAFRLRAEASQVEHVLAMRRGEGYRSLRLLDDADCVIVAKLDSVRRLKRYEVHGHPYGEHEVELTVETPPRFVAEGTLLEVAALPRLSDAWRQTR